MFGPSLALRLGAGFAPVRKQGKLPGPCETAGYQKEYGEDFFQIQVNLKCWVKVKEDWRNREGLIRSFGLSEK